MVPLARTGAALSGPVGALEGSQYRVAALDGRIESLLRRLLALERLLQLLLNDVADLRHVAQAQPPGVLGGLGARELKVRDIRARVLLVIARRLHPLVASKGD